MKIKMWGGGRPLRVPWVACAWLLSIPAFAQLGQGVLAPPPASFAGLPPELETTGTNEPGRAVFGVPGVAPLPEKPLLAFGQVELHPHFLYRLSYGNGLQTAPGEQSDTLINQIYPGITISLGPHWSLDYTPSLTYYSSSHFQDTVDHSVNLSGGTSYRNWTFGLSQAYTTSQQPLVQTAAQTSQETYSTSLSASCGLSSVLSLDLGASQIFNFLEQSVAGQQLSDSRSWSTLDWLNYQLTPHLRTGIGLGFGYDSVDIGADMTHEQFQGRVDLRAGEKLDFLASGGAEVRQYLDSSVPDSVTPIFAVSAQYALFKTTVFNLTVNRNVSPALFADQTTVSTTVSGGVSQRLFGKAQLNVNGGYFSSSYGSTSVAGSVNRQDHGDFASVSLGIPVLKRGTASLFYQGSWNSSNEPGFGYSTSQGGIEFGYRF